MILRFTTAIAILILGTVRAQEVEQSVMSFLDSFLAESDSSVLVVDPILHGAITSMEAGDNESAVAELTDIVLKAPDNTEAFRLQASCFVRLQDLEGAIEACMQIAALDSLDNTAHITLGYLYHALGDADNAELYYSSALEKDPNAHLASFGLGWIYLERRNLDGAHEAATRITEIAPDYGANYILLGRVLTMKGFYKEAARAYRRAFSLDSTLRTRYGILEQELTVRHRLSR